MIPVPLVSVRNCERNPIRPRAGMRNSRRTRPLPWFTIFVMVPRRVPAGLADKVITRSTDEARLKRLDKAFFYSDFVIEDVI